MIKVELNDLLEKFNGNKSNIARLFGVSRQAVNYWFKRGAIPKIRLYELPDDVKKMFEEETHAN